MHRGQVNLQFFSLIIKKESWIDKKISFLRYDHHRRIKEAYFCPVKFADNFVFKICLMPSLSLNYTPWRHLNLKTGGLTDHLISDTLKTELDGFY